MVTVRVPLPPCVIVVVAGCRLAMVGGAVLTSTVALTEPSFNVAVIWTFPTATAVTGMVMLV